MRYFTVGLLLLMCSCKSGPQEGVVQKELGKTEQEYVARFGAAVKSPETPDQAAYNNPNGGMVQTRVVDGRSVEELWMLTDEGKGLPDFLAKRVQKAVDAGTSPTRRVTLSLKNTPPLEIFELPDGAGVIAFERQRGTTKRVALCLDRAACRLLDNVIEAERKIDESMARAAEAMHAQ